MSATLTTNSAAPSPSPAQPDTSPVSGDSPDADFGLPNAADISAALDELNPTTQADADPAATSPEADDEADTATEEAVAATLSDEAAAPASDESTPPSEGQPPEGEAAPVAADPDVAAAPSKRDGRNDRIDELTAGGNAASAGLQIGDVLVRVSATLLKSGAEGQYEKEGYGQRPYTNCACPRPLLSPPACVLTQAPCSSRLLQGTAR